MISSRPLADRVRPKSFNDVIGQDHLVGEKGVITLMLANNRLMSFILYGSSGCGKTTIANIIVHRCSHMQSFVFNASSDSKDVLKDALHSLVFNKNIILIVDEIHRMNKDVQDCLLPYIENGSVILIGLTTENPYRTVNRAVRSRCHIYNLQPIVRDQIKRLITDISINERYDLSDEIIDYIVDASSCEIRTAINILDVISIVPVNDRSIENISKIVGIKHIAIDDGLDNYYHVLSALIKSIRGSDIDAAMHYLARFLKCEDIPMLIRRLLILAYEDIGLANPQIGPQVYAACESAIMVGMPEARIPLSVAVILLASSPKSNSAYQTYDKACDRIDTLSDKTIPAHLNNNAIKFNGEKYLYPHNYHDHYVKQQYLPDEAIGDVYYIPQSNSKYEAGIKEYWTKVGMMQKSIKPK